MPLFTIYAVHADNHQKFSSTYQVDTWEEAVELAQEETEGNLIVAAVVDADHNIVDL